MPNLNLDVDYFDHPKTKRLVGLLGRGADVLPIRLWSYCGKFHSEDGKLSGYSGQEIESIVGWWGKSGQMMPAFEKAVFAHAIEDGWEIHQWNEHQGHIVAFKKRGIIANKARWDKYHKDATSIPKEAVEESPNPTIPTDPTLIQRERVGDGVASSGKRLHGIPATVEEVIRIGEILRPKKDEKTCREFWAHYEGQARTNASGEVFWITSGEAIVTNWKVKLSTFGDKTSEPHKSNAKPGPNRNAGTYNEQPTGKYSAHVAKQNQ